ncbi:MAG: helix-hairpin-helix domain-containing protein, partial [Bacteroidales bacterium]|nr:helix-hairpin-helix domain-containing protein [Bacteroidales bacterium]
INYYTTKEKSSYGWCINQACSFKNNQSSLQVDGNLAYFNTGDWNTRINFYEKNVLYANFFSNYYGKGWRYSLVLKWQIVKPLTFYFKWGSTHYSDRESIGSGTEEIQGKIKTDIYGSIKYKF